MNELEKKLAEIRAAIKGLLALGEEIGDDEAKKLDGLNKEALKLSARVEAQKQSAADEAETAARIEREKAEAVAEARREEAAKARRLSFGGDAPYQAKYSDLSKYDELSAGETALVIETLNTNGRQVSGAAFKALSIKIGELKDDNSEEGRKGVNYVRNAFKASTNIEPTAEATSAAVKAATDPMYTGGSGIGSDWVGTAYSSELWAAIRAANVVVNRVPSEVIPDGYSSKYWPLESTDPTWYKVAEATASDATLKVPAATIAASQLATANKQLTVGKLGARSLYTGELTEDSLIAFAPNLRRQLEVSGAEILEHVAIDGDVETSANKNINDIAGTPAGTEPFLLMDGFRKLALVTNTANSRSAGGTLSIEDFKNTLKLMGVAGLAGADPTKVAFIVDYNVMWAMLDLPELKTRDVSSFATIENGFVTRVYRTDVLYAFQMHRAQAARKAQTDGKIDLDTDGDNTTGSILSVRFDQWKQAFKRRMTLETTRIANADSWEIVALVRWGLAYRDNEASAISYNVGI
jgi:hypothetical protein